MTELAEFLSSQQIHESWHDFFAEHWEDLEATLRIVTKVESLGPEVRVIPATEERFRVFRGDLTKIRVVLLGQEPYHEPGLATGLAFSVPRDAPIPPVLRNLFQELSDTFPGLTFEHGDLSAWAERGIFLLNISLTVRQNEGYSHLPLWSGFTDAVLQHIHKENPDAAFLFLGAFAREKAKLLGPGAKVVTAAHPSPMSANRGFFGSGCFGKLGKNLGNLW